METLSPDEAADALVSHLLLRTPFTNRPKTAIPKLLDALRHIQLDPLDVLGTNADLVAMARVDGLRRGEVYDRLMPGHAFEHFAKERCLLPKRYFPWYRRHIAETRWWGLETRLTRLPPALIEQTLATLSELGPATAPELEAAMLARGHAPGRVTPMDWSGWKGTSRAVSMALEVLWARCDVAVVGRRTRQLKVWDVAERAFPEHSTPVEADREAFLRWALLERVEAAGLLSRASGPHWSTLADARESGLADQLVAEGALVEVRVTGSPRSYLASPTLLPSSARSRRRKKDPDDDGRMRILGPLDPLLWDRKLVAHAFGFDYVWEVYKPADKRRWGYYVLPLLQHGRLVGRFEGHLQAPPPREDGAPEPAELVVDTLWPESSRRFDRRAFQRAIDRHAAMMSLSPKTSSS